MSGALCVSPSARLPSLPAGVRLGVETTLLRRRRSGSWLSCPRAALAGGRRQQRRAHGNPEAALILAGRLCRESGSRGRANKRPPIARARDTCPDGLLVGDVEGDLDRDRTDRMKRRCRGPSTSTSTAASPESTSTPSPVRPPCLRRRRRRRQDRHLDEPHRRQRRLDDDKLTPSHELRGVSCASPSILRRGRQ